MNKRLLAAAFGSAIALPAFAGVNQIYSPIVEYREFELEVKHVTNREDQATESDFTKLEGAYGFTEWWKSEVVMAWEKQDNGDRDLAAYESENIFQLTEQGKYFADLSIFAELEVAPREHAHEYVIGPLLQSDLGRFTVTANLLWGKEIVRADVREEPAKWQRETNLQLKYRAGALEPAVEYYGEQEAKSIGPVLLGEHHVGSIKVKWQAGLLFGMNAQSPDQSLRFQVEFEFK